MIGAIIGNGMYYASPMQKQREQKQAQKEELIKKNYEEIYHHELAHKIAGGKLAGAIVIEKNSEGIPFAGHVDIKMPSLNVNNPQQTINDADTVIRSAMAPADPSSQDYNVARQAQSIKTQAQNRLNVMA